MKTVVDAHDQLELLISRAWRESRGLSKQRMYQALSKNCVEAIRFVCESLNLGQSIAFRAYEIYNRFLIRFNDKLNESTRNLDSSEHLSVGERIMAQGSLRLCTCILLAYKIQADNQSPLVNVQTFMNVLNLHGYSYKKEAICKSEMRVITTLNFRLLWPSPYEIVEGILAVFFIDGLDEDRLRHYAMELLEFVYLEHEKIYRKFWFQKRRQGRVQSNDRGARNHFKFTMEFNIPLRSASIVSAAAFIVLPDLSNRYPVQLGRLTSIPEMDIADLSILLLDELLHPHHRP